MHANIRRTILSSSHPPLFPACDTALRRGSRQNGINNRRPPTNAFWFGAIPGLVYLDIRFRSAYNSPAFYGEPTDRDYEALVKAAQDKRIRAANTKE